MITNRIITRGMGRSRGTAGSAGMVTQGYAGVLATVVQAAGDFIRRIRGGAHQKRKEEDYESVHVSAKLIEINDISPQKRVEGYVRVGIDRTRSHKVTLFEHLSSRIANAYNKIKISVKRIR